jgi:hypothetical protein
MRGGRSGPSTQTRRPPPKSGCELWPFASVSGSCPPIAEDETDGDDGDDHQQDLHENSLLCGWSARTLHLKPETGNLFLVKQL